MLKEKSEKDDYVLPEKGVYLKYETLDGKIIEYEGHSIVFLITEYEDNGEDLDVIEKGGAYGLMSDYEACVMTHKLRCACLLEAKENYQKKYNTH